jgi:hypothetical protein
MTAMSTQPRGGSEVFRIDREHDRLAASDGVSRYGHYVRDRIPCGFAECWDGTFGTRLAERFAALAWRTATGPVMAPPYADWRSPVLSARCGLDPDGDSGGLIATVEIASPWPAALGRGRIGGRSWQSWPRDYSFGRGEDYVRDPYPDEVARGGYYALASLQLVFPIAAGLLPDAPRARHRPGEVEETARQAVAVVVAEPNRAAGPVISVLERS